uniref:Adipokinetic hormone-corazonin-like peptide n=1 Tax=Lygus hesperus TaxID=30085 RepID=A0A7T7VQ63_LYGHE|nr:adipokinetic hormone-corazonin-like peptide precursor [Lygus hesperus]
MDSKRISFTTAIVSLAWLLIISFQFTDAQVTFSRDWNAGKRSMSVPECSIPLRSATSVCQMLINEMRAITNCELKSLLAGRGDDNESNSDVFFPPRTG